MGVRIVKPKDRIINIYNLKDKVLGCNVCRADMINSHKKIYEMSLGCENTSQIIRLCEDCISILYEKIWEVQNEK